MTTKTGYTYNVSSAGIIYGGKFGPVPSWIATMPINTWKAVPASNVLSSLDPKLNPAINPVYPSNPEWNGSGFSGLITAWNSMTFNPETGELIIGGVGGHADYGGNEVYRINLSSNIPSWQMLGLPSGAIGRTITDGGAINDAFHIAASATGVYSDGRMRPVHSYDTINYVPNKGLVVTNLYFNFPHINGPSKAVYFNEATQDWAMLSDYTGLGDSNAPQGGSCYDSTRNCLWLLGYGTYGMVKIDCNTGVATKIGVVSGHANNKMALRYDSINDLVYIIAASQVGYPDYPSGLTVFNPVTGLFHPLPTISGSLPSGLPYQGQGCAWDEIGGRLLLWGATDRKKIGTLTRPTSGSLLTTPWTAGELTLSGSNTVTPSNPTTNGTYGCFGYIEKLGGCFLLNSVNESIYFYKIKEVT